jgi:hypothetical protein
MRAPKIKIKRLLRQAFHDKWKPNTSTPALYNVCDRCTEYLLYFQVIFSPWAFGATQAWSMWVLNITAYLLGLMLFCKWIIRWRISYLPQRWGSRGDSAHHINKGEFAARVLTALLAGVTVLFLGLSFVSALNAQSSYSHKLLAFDYYDYIAWAPSSVDGGRTWFNLWCNLGLALTFWAARDWLLGKSIPERRHYRRQHARVLADKRLFHSLRKYLSAPERLQKLLLVLMINGALLGLVGIMQRLSGTDQLLWIVQPFINADSTAQFGPYAYRSNAAQYLNLLCPICIGFGWILYWTQPQVWERKKSRSHEKYLILIPCTFLMVAAPIVSSSRGGAVVAVMQFTVSVIILIIANRSKTWLFKVFMLIFVVVVAVIANDLGGNELMERFRSLDMSSMSGRAEIYENSKEIAQDYVVFGSGAGTFGSIYQLYKGPNEVWQGYLHDDWLETRITYGWVGVGLILLMLLSVYLKWFCRGGIAMPWPFAMLLWVSLAGCIFHAKFDFPFQVFSVQHLFVLLSSILFSISHKK